MEALELLVNLGGVGKEDEEGSQELNEWSRDKGCCRGRHKTHETNKRQNLIEKDKKK